MSIILDALKKAQAGGEGSEEGATNSNPVSGGASGIFRPESPDSGAKSKSMPKMDLAALKSMDPKKLKLFGLVAIVGVGLIVVLALNMDILFGGGKKTQIVIDQTKVKTVKQQDKKEEKKSADDTKVKRMKKEAMDYFENRQYDKAVYVFKQLVDVSPTDAEVRNNFGLALKKLGKLKEAKQSYHTALALKPDYPAALNNLAVMEITDRQYNQAKKRLVKAIELEPEYLDPYLHLAICYEKSGEVQLAQEYYNMFLERSEGKISRKVRLQIENRLARLQDF